MGGGDLEIWYRVTGTGTQAELGVLSIQLFESTDRVNWTRVTTFEFYDTEGMLAHNTFQHMSHVDYQGRLGKYYRAYELDMDGAETSYVNRVCGTWENNQLCGFVWEYIFDSDPYRDKREETVSFRDPQGLTIFGVDAHQGKFIGVLAESLQNLELRYGRCFRCRNGRLSWGKVEREGRLYIGQLAEIKEGAYYADEYVPHGFCVEMEGEKILFCGMFDMGVRKGPGAEMKPAAAEGPFRMEYKVW
jgi:hypothetical protein